MKRTVFLGCAVLTMALSLPIHGRAAQSTQPSIDDAYTSYYIAVEPQRTVLAEKFLTDFKGSKDPSAEQYFESAFGTILGSSTKANNFAKVMDYVDKTEQFVPGASADRKANYYEQGMIAAQQSNNVPKTISFGDKVLSLVPDGPAVLNTLITLSSTLPAVPGADKTALEKSDQYATRALAIVAKLDPKTLGLGDAAWSSQRTGIEGTLHTTLGGNAYTRGDYDKAVEELTIATKLTPKEGLPWYQMGLALSQQAAAISKKYGEAVAATNKLVATRNADRGDIDEMKATSDALAEALRPKRDAAIDAFATAVALGGPPADPARAQLQKLWSQKNSGSMDGLDAFINSKKQG